MGGQGTEQFRLGVAKGFLLSADLFIKLSEASFPMSKISIYFLSFVLAKQKR